MSDHTHLNYLTFPQHVSPGELLPRCPPSSSWVQSAPCSSSSAEATSLQEFQNCYILYVYMDMLYIYICTCSYLSLSLLCYISSKRDNKHDESTDLSNIQIRNMVLKINRHVLLSQGFNRPPNKFWCCRNLKAMLLGPRRAARFSSHGFGNGWKWCVCTAQNSSRPTF